MTILKFMPAPKEQYIIKSTRDITLGFIQNGYAVINKILQNSLPANRCRTDPKNLLLR
ncbi:hypothetical protein [Cyclobacterium xiamenense]|uniref:hypothetical protein n=1 Tax=Cyclobacterium xiamenense TaxID=1297121 RepID=UPI0012B73DAA|nr:hypothetical protein [Cyclobacterium xiamenense]